MREFFVVANSFAAPFVSDTSTRFVTAESPQAALEKFAGEYSHKCGLYAAECYESADAYHKRERPLAKWLSNRARGLTPRTPDPAWEREGGVESV